MITPCLLTNSFTKCLYEKRLTIVIVGNSVSYGAAFDGDKVDSYYVYLADWFRRTFPDATIDLKLGIIFATGPEVQLFRMDDKVLKHPADLVVTEFGAANGAWGERGREVTECATEGYFRRLRFLRPEADIFMNLGIVENMMEIYADQKTPASAAFQQNVARHYGCALADSGAAIANRVLSGEPWGRFMNDSIHPGPQGYAVHGAAICEELDRQYLLYCALPAEARAVKVHTLPAKSLLSDAWVSPRLFPGSAASLDGFTPGESGIISYMEASAPGASGSFSPPTGKIAGVLYHYPCDTGDGQYANLEVRMDGVGDWKRLSLQDEPRFPEESDRDNCFRRQFFGAYDLPLLCRRLEFRVVNDGNGAHPLRIVSFFVVEN